MHKNIAELRKAFESGKIDRRQLMQALGLTATAAFAAGAFPEATAFAGGAAQMNMAGSTALKAVAYNHLNYTVHDYAKVRDFYVNMFGMKVVYDDGKQCSVECGDPPNAIYIRPLNRPLDRPAGTGENAKWAEQMGTGNVDHFALSVENFQLEAVRAELARRGLDPKPDGDYAWTIKDPAGVVLQICATRGVYPGAAAPTAKESDGTKNLSSIPGPDGSGFKAVAVSHLMLYVPDVDKCRDFYTEQFGMKIVYYRPGDVFGVDAKGGPICFMKFGDNYLYLRKSQHPENKPYVSHFALIVENYDQAAVKAKLEKLGYKPTPDGRYGWSITDPAGMRTEVAGKGMAEHDGGDCNGNNAVCPGGADK
ncbi:MAG TPA: VOC family protein [Candidatus Saccharimonadales bacterium]|jgi:catechol 2,3-dioxygenase-like lactoylglutathione lyase family enzyme|nr:VOC family protein [Candidatus Saccharimonadales bacterium]